MKKILFTKKQHAGILRMYLMLIMAILLGSKVHAQVTFSTSPVTMDINDITRITVTPASATDMLTFTASQSGYISISKGSGYLDVTGIQSTGSTTLLIRAIGAFGSIQGQVQVIVNSSPTITGIDIEQTEMHFDIFGQSQQVIASFEPENCATCPEQVADWYSSNTSVATVNSSGLVTSVGNGTTEVFATPEGYFSPGDYINPLIGGFDYVTITVDADPETDFVGDIRLKPSSDQNDLDIIFGNPGSENGRIWTSGSTLNIGRLKSEPSIGIDYYGKVSIPELKGSINVDGDLSLSEGRHIQTSFLEIKRYPSSDLGWMSFTGTGGQLIGTLKSFDYGLMSASFKNKMRFWPIDKTNVTPLLLQNDGSVLINANTGWSDDDLIPTDGHKLLVNGTIKCDGISFNGNFIDDNINITGDASIGGKLQINGNTAIHGKLEAKEIKVILSPTADHVFKDDYKLRTLSETEAFINANKHLPEIASATEMVENGVNMAEFQIQLLQKIEELTLYVIELEKKSAAQENRINELENLK